MLSYRDDADGTMVEAKDMSGRFVDVCLRPCVVISSDSSPDKARTLLDGTQHRVI